MEGFFDDVYLKEDAVVAFSGRSFIPADRESASCGTVVF
jgi:hypothetical protein